MKARLPQIRMDAVELQHLREAAAFYAMTVSDFVRLAVTEQITRLKARRVP